MEEDIEIIEDKKDMFIDTLYEYYRQSEVKPFEKAIENLINRVKDLEQIEAEHQKENGELREQVKELEESHDYIYEAYQDAGKKMFEYSEQLEKLESKIREKIEELKSKSGGNVFHIQQTINAEIRFLQELLGG